ncbi:hypothetical protein SBI_04646 [Streptomyces bingchenggensis BCW-1]|uniref:Uncharacterized protein n=1 Tax=Streptomyces bingchenggensis (strain BCW-1) TaxID=749414 RepID=D7BXJ3_STRBB|nr:hypothetical protein SBI_04646 [Streptomyces bingchenggensis BCW-1]
MVLRLRCDPDAVDGTGHGLGAAPGPFPFAALVALVPGEGERAAARRRSVRRRSHDRVAGTTARCASATPAVLSSTVSTFMIWPVSSLCTSAIVSETIAPVKTVRTNEASG